jgi:hypothetical protein
LPEYQYNADNSKRNAKDPMGKVMEMIAGILSVKAQRKTNKDAR